MSGELQIQVPEDVRDGVALAEQMAEIEVKSDLTLAIATGALADLRRAKDRAEEARQFLVRPLNEHVKAINDTFKPKTTALDDAIRTLKRKVAGYHERKQREEQQAARAAAEFVGASPEVTDIVASAKVPTRSHTATGSTNIVTRWDYEVTDIKALCAAVAAGTLPEALVQPNKGELRRWLNELDKSTIQGDGFKVRGLRVFKTTDVAVHT